MEIQEYMEWTGCDYNEAEEAIDSMKKGLEEWYAEIENKNLPCTVHDFSY